MAPTAAPHRDDVRSSAGRRTGCCVTNCVTTSTNTGTDTRTLVDVTRRMTWSFGQVAGGVSLLETVEVAGSISVAPTSGNGLFRWPETPFRISNLTSTQAHCADRQLPSAYGPLPRGASRAASADSTLAVPSGKSPSERVVDLSEHRGDLSVEHLSVAAERHGDVGWLDSVRMVCASRAGTPRLLSIEAAVRRRSWNTMFR